MDSSRQARAIPHSARGDVDPSELQPGEDLLEAAALALADEVLARHHALVEHQLAGIDALVAELLELASHPEALALLDQQQAHAAVARPRLRVGLDQHRDDVALDAVADPGLGAVDPVAVAVAAGGGPDRLQVGAAVGLGERDPAAQLPGGETRKEAGLLGFAAEALHRRGHDEVRVENPGYRHPHRGHPLDDLRVGGGGQAEAAVLLADGGAEEPELAHLLDDLGRPGVGRFEIVHVGPDLALEEAIHRVEDEGLVVVRPEVVGHAGEGAVRRIRKATRRRGAPEFPSMRNGSRCARSLSTPHHPRAETQ